MNLAIGIKNSMFVLLIILIIHVILKNKSKENYDNCNPIKETNMHVQQEKKKVIANCEIKQDKKNMMIINEYEEDKKQDDDISAYDDFDINYEYYLRAEKAAETENKHPCKLITE
jgi:hypothetical protein